MIVGAQIHDNLPNVLPNANGPKPAFFILNNETGLSDTRWELEGRPESFYGHSIAVFIFTDVRITPKWDESPQNRV